MDVPTGDPFEPPIVWSSLVLQSRIVSSAIIHTSISSYLAPIPTFGATPAPVARQASEGRRFICPTEYLNTAVSFDRYGYIVCHYKLPERPYAYNDCSYWLVCTIQ
jgi:hypothetical protein